MKRYFFVFIFLTSFLFSENQECIVDRYGNSLLHNAVLKKDIVAIEKLLDADIEIDETNYKGQTALHLAVKTNSIEIAKMLIENHATISIYDVYNFSPLYYANHLKYFDLANLLKRNGAKAEIRVVSHKSELKNFISEFDCKR